MRLGRRALVIAAIAAAACHRSPERARDAGVTRVVSLSPSTTETVAELGGLPRLVGRSRYCDYPVEVTKVPEVGGYVDPNVEAIVALRPDLVVGARGPAGHRIDDILREHAIDTYFPETETIADVLDMVRGIGERLDRRAEAGALVAKIQARLAEIEDQTRALPHPRVLLLFGVQPIVAAGPKSFGDEITRHAGALNAVVSGDTYPALDLEAVAALDPDVIVDAAVAEEHGGQRIGKDAPGWRELRAVKQSRVVMLADEAVLRPGPRVADGVATLARALHPELH